MSGFVFKCLDLYFGCLDLYFGCLNLYFGCLNLYFGCSGGRRDGRTDGRAGGRVGWVQIIGKNQFGEYVPWKTLILYILLNADILVFWQKRRAPKNAAFWRAVQAEISHMRPIQARKLKLIEVCISHYFHVIFICFRIYFILFSHFWEYAILSMLNTGWIF